MRVYKIETNLTNKENNNLLKNISDEDANILSSLDIKVSVDLLDESDKLTTIMVTNILNLEKLKEFFNRNNILTDIEDITDEFTNIDELDQNDILQKFGIEV
jgi:hypothetical protein